MKRLDPSHVPAALHTAKSASRLALFLALRMPGVVPAELVQSAFEILGYDLTIASIKSGADPTVARALDLTRHGMGVQS